MFLHTNFKPKWDLQLPDDMRMYMRRWAVLQPGNLTFLDEAFLDLEGRDPEMEVHPLRSPVCGTPSECSGSELCLRNPGQLAALNGMHHQAHPAPHRCMQDLIFTGCIMIAYPMQAFLV